MSIDDPDQLKHLKAAGRIVAAAIRLHGGDVGHTIVVTAGAPLILTA
jgi:hypothetical protein